MAKKDTITFQVAEEDGWLTAKWDAPMGRGGITTQAQSLPELFRSIAEAVQCHFDDDELPGEVRLHFANDPALNLREAA
jgi:hypothetical protein